jgi:hypothetical protein
MDVPDMHQVKNPDALGSQERKLWQRIEPILDELLDELRAKGKIETSYVESEMKHLNSIIENLNTISTNNNLLLHAVDTEKKKAFLDAISEFGFTDSSFTHLYLEVSALLLVQYLECFKTILLFHLRNVDFLVSHFDRTMQESAPKAWKKLKPILDNKFRNSLSHGMWAIENKKIILFEDSKLVPFAKLDLTEFIIRIKTQNVLGTCLINLIDKKGKEGFFA